MAKLKNLFVGCPVTHKDHPNTLGIVVILSGNDHDRGPYVCWANNSGLNDTYYLASYLKLAPFPDADKAFHHLNRFENV